MSHSLLFRSGRVLALAALTLVLGASAAVAQQSRVEGTVRSSQSRDPVANARVSVVGTNLFSTTNENGYYAIENVPVGSYDVRVQVIGFQSVVFTNQRVAAGLPTTVNFELSPSILRIEGVVVTGVAEATQAVKLPFTVEQLGGEEMPVPTQSAEESIRGKVAGARVIRGQGRPGTGVTVLLRGATSINTAGRSNEPLYVVDGVILGASMVDIDALDIENIEIVKGAAAAALYGARAANGVMSITTRRGSQIPDGETRITMRTEYGQNGIERPIEMSRSHWWRLDETGTQWLGTAADGLTDSLVAGADRTLALREHDWVLQDDRVEGSTDWDGDGTFTTHDYMIVDNPYPAATFDHMDRLFNPGSFRTNTVAVSHRTGSTNFRASAHETAESGILSGLEGYRRRGARINVDHRIGRTLDFNATAYYSQSVSDDPGGGENAFFGLMFYSPDVDLLELNPVEVRRDSNDFLVAPDPLQTEVNPMYSSANSDIVRVRGRVLGSFGIRWRPIEAFDLQSEVSLDRSDRNRTDFYFKGYRFTDADERTQGQLTKEQWYDQALNASVSATYRQQIGDLNTSFKGRVLLERSKAESFFARAQNLVVDNVEDMDLGQADLSEVGGESDEIRSLGAFLSGQFDFKDRYLADVLVRRDGSSLFGEDQRYHWYYRAGAAYRMSEESWWPLAFIDEFKLRYSRGTAGGRPRFSAQYETYDVSGGVVSKGNLGNVNLKPEHVTETEFGVDMILGGRVSIAVTRALSRSEDQILLVPLAGFYGFGNQYRNAGTVEGWTWEGTMQAAMMQSDKFGWNLGFVIDKTRQRITDFDLPPYRTGPGNAFYVREGEYLGTMYGRRWATTCAEILTSGGLSAGGNCGAFDMNDDGYMVPVGEGNSWTDGIDQNYYGSTIVIDGSEYTWGYPIPGYDVRVDTLPSGDLVTDTTNFVETGSSIPDFNFGVTNDFRFGGLSLHVLFDAQIGGDIYNNRDQYPIRDNFGWQIDQVGKVENTKKPVNYYQTLYFGNSNSSHWVQDATFVKLRELSLRYTFNRGQLESVLGGTFSRISVSLIGRNLKTWTDYTGFDPEVSTSGDAGIYRYDGFQYPNYRTFTGAVEIEF